MIISESIKDLVLEKELSISEISKSVKISKSLLSMYVRGFTIPNIKNSIKLAKFFNCSLNYLLGITAEKKNFVLKADGLSFYKHLENLLEVNNITAYKLFKDTGLPDSSLTRWKKGIIPKVETLIILANYFGCSVDYLIGAANA